jgi:hypothetical protein
MCEGNPRVGKIDDVTQLPQMTVTSSNIERDIQSFFRILQIIPSSCRIVRLCSWLVVLLLLPGCNTLNPLCGSARPVPILDSISPKTIVFSQLPSSFVIIATGSHFVSSSAVVFNGATLATTVTSSSQLRVTITSSMIPAVGSFNVVVKTPPGNTGDLGCSSGGISRGQVLIVN